MSFADIERNLLKIQKQIEKEAIKAMQDTMEDIAQQSITECPLDTGALRESFRGEINGEGILEGNKNGVKRKRKKVEVKTENIGTLSYNTPYALIQHEELSFNHPAPGTKAKYLEDPLKENEARYHQALQDAVNEVLK